MIHTCSLVDGTHVSVEDAGTAGALAISAAKGRCAMEILAVYPEYRQRNAGLGILDETEVTAMRAHILACKATEDAYTDSVESILAGAGSDAEKIAAIEAL